MDKTETDPRNNPYLAHMYADASTNGNSSSSGTNSAFAKLKRHQTTAALAKEIEDGEVNPFTGQPFSSTSLSCRLVVIFQCTSRGKPVQTQMRNLGYK
jgi:pre-mRNA-splicing factor ATP-dependent RNA helicase DHX15/PRP43